MQLAALRAYNMLKAMDIEVFDWLEFWVDYQTKHHQNYYPAGIIF
jgi:hypothetical protein